MLIKICALRTFIYYIIHPILLIIKALNIKKINKLHIPLLYYCYFGQSVLQSNFFIVPFNTPKRVLSEFILIFTSGLSIIIA